MAVKAVTRDGVEAAIEEFRRTGLEAMLEKYGGGPSTKWYLEVGTSRYDQKLVVRAAHVLQGLGDLPPLVPGDFTAGQSRHRWERLGYRVVPKLSQTNENLEGPSATEPLSRWLIGAARQSTTLAYSDAASRLEKECGFSPIFPALRMGRTAAGAPVRNSCARSICSSPQRLARPKGSWAAWERCARFPSRAIPRGVAAREEDADEVHPEVWARYARLAIEEAHRYGGWEALYEQLFGPARSGPVLRPRRRAGGGEGPNHKALREWLRKHPECVDRRLRDVDSKTEVDLLSGDRVDVVYRTKSQVITIEVKSRDSNWSDLQRGIYQCVKYRAVMEAQEKEEKSGRRVRALLVTEIPLYADLDRIADRLDVPHRQVIPGTP